MRTTTTASSCRASLTFVGDRLGIDLYLVALFAFGLRIFQNVALIRRHFL
jgi:small basic protein